MRLIVAPIAFVLIAGCSAPKTEDTASSAEATPSVGTPTTGGVTPMAGGAATGMSPMSGTESVEGAGMGGLGQAAKDKARQAAAGGNVPEPNPEDGQ